MDYPQWYNSKLWNTSKQTVDGKTIRSMNRSQSANISNRLSSVYSGSGNWSVVAKSSPVLLPNKEKNYPYRLSSPQRVGVKSATYNSGLNNSSNFYSSLPINYRFQSGNQRLFNQPQILTLNNKVLNVRDSMSLNQNLQRPKDKVVQKQTISPNYVEYESDYNVLPTKFDVVHGNLTNVKKSDGNSEIIFVESPREEENTAPQIPSEEVIEIQENSQVPNNTPRIVCESSQVPIKSILKKSVNSPENNFSSSLSLYNSFHVSRLRTFSATSKPSNSNSSPVDFRRSLQSASGGKREVRFNMSVINVIEYTPHE